MRSIRAPSLRSIQFLLTRANLVPSAPEGPANAPPAVSFGGGNLQAIFEAAASYWEQDLVSDRTVNLYYTWQPRGTTQIGSALTTNPSASVSSAYIRFSSDVQWFMDSTPLDNDEFTNYTESTADLGGGQLVTERVFNNGIGDAAGRNRSIYRGAA